MLLTSTVIMATFNGSKYIHDQLQSIFNQSILPTRVIIRDDKSSDDTAEIVNQFIDGNNLRASWDFKVNQKRKGWRENFISMLRQTETDVVFYSDQDDIWQENKVEATLTAFEAEEEMEVLVSDYVIIPKEQNLLVVRQLEETPVSSQLYKVDLTLTNLAVYRPGCGMALRKSIIDSTIEILRRVKVDFNAVAQTHDQAAWLAAVARGTLYHLHQPLFIRRIHPDSTWQTEKKQHKDHLYGDSLSFVVYLKAVEKFFAGNQSYPYFLQRNFQEEIKNKIRSFSVDELS
ncbi:glycosyl transferase [Oenococcus oeni S25]|uniref:glycosyltransferase family 2 protein n=1 Tax=Oenococcus oeni TaxID=1247 RepID=UPI00050DBD68|nr:glycosyltransferase family 2 protein [Oenococcus oeni]KGH70566.1 glycosyl transferase [Oenococcus oeni S25]